MMLSKKLGFFGSEPAMGAEKHLKEQNENGLFLVRLNMGGSTPVDVSPFTISSLINSQVSHTRVVFESNRSQLKFQDIDGKTVTFENSGILDFMNTIRKQYSSVFRKPCTKSTADAVYVFNEAK